MPHPARRRAALAAAVLLAAAAWAAADAVTPPATLTTRPVALTPQRPADEPLGRLRALGMLELPAVTAGNLRLTQLSGLAWDEDDGVLYAISDKGALFHLQPLIEHGRLTGVRLLRAVALREPDGQPVRGARVDAEGLEIVDGANGRRGDAELLVSFERDPRIVRYRPDGRALGELALPAALAGRGAYAGRNLMLEALCRDPALGVITAPEAPLRGEEPGMTRLFALSGQSWRYPLPAGGRIAALECLGDGNVLVLERDFGRLFGPNAVTLRQATLPKEPTDAPLAVTPLATLDAAAGLAIDNFEGLARERGRRFFLVSDNNDLGVQRTLLLYFELLPD
jgi:hypothetical protein